MSRSLALHPTAAPAFLQIRARVRSGATALLFKVMADFGQSNFGRSILGRSIFVLLLCVVVCCRTLLRRTPPRAGPPKFSLFSFPLPPPFRSFSLSGVFSLNFVVFFEGRDPQMCTFALSGCRVKPRRLWGTGLNASQLPWCRTRPLRLTPSKQARLSEY